MNIKDIAKHIFSLAVRLLGLYLFYVGLKGLDTPALLDVTIIRVEAFSDIVNAVLPVLFNLGVAWWLLGNRFLTMRAFPETSRIVEHFRSPSEQVLLVPKPQQSQELTKMEAAEEKLAVLIGKPNGDRAAVKF
jgi:hypothetical protein